MVSPLTAILPRHAAKRLPVPAWAFIALACVEVGLLRWHVGLAQGILRDSCIIADGFFIGWDISFALWTAVVNKRAAETAAA